MAETALLPLYILDALHNPADHSINGIIDFSNRISCLKELLSSKMKVSFLHDKDMNYSSAQSLSFHYGTKDTKEKPTYLFEIRYYISSKADLFAVYVFDERMTVMKGEKLNHPVDTKRLPIRVQEMIGKGSAILEANGYKEVDFDFFMMPAPGCETELDGLPANVFEALFTEIV